MSASHGTRKQSHLDAWGGGVDPAEETLCPAPGCNSDAFENRGEGFVCAECGRAIADERVRLIAMQGGDEE